MTFLSTIDLLVQRPPFTQRHEDSLWMHAWPLIQDVSGLASWPKFSSKQDYPAKNGVTSDFCDLESTL